MSALWALLQRWLVLVLVLQVVPLDARVTLYASIGAAQGSGATALTSATTYRYFQDRLRWSEPSVSGVLLTLTPDNSQSCAVDASLPPLNTTNDAAAASGTVISLLEARFLAAGCTTYAQMAEMVAAFGDSLRARGYPPVQVILLHLARKPFASQYHGGPMFSEYRSPSFAIPDGMPILPMALLPPDESELIIAATTGMGGVPQYAVVEDEPGPWNELFTSAWYQTIIYLLITIHVLLLLRAGYVLFRYWQAGLLRLDYRISIYLIGLISAILFTVVLCMNQFSLTGLLIRKISNIIACVALFLVLYTGNWLYGTIHSSRWVRMRTGIICTASLLIITNYVQEIIRYFGVIREPQYAPLRRIISMVVLCVYFMNGTVLAYFGVMFARTGRRLQRGDKTRAILLRFGWIGTLGSLAIFTLFVTNTLQLVSASVVFEFGSMIGFYITHLFGTTLQSAVLLFLLSVTPPSRSSHRRLRSASNAVRPANAALDNDVWRDKALASTGFGRSVAYTTSQQTRHGSSSDAAEYVISEEVPLEPYRTSQHHDNDITLTSDAATSLPSNHSKDMHC